MLDETPAEPASPSADPALVTCRAGGPGLVALVDDDERVRALAGLALARQGFGVVGAGCAVDGLDLVTRHDPDLVVLDVVMPDMSGWEVLRRVRAASDVPIMVVSSRDGDVDKARGLDLGADDYLAKPFSFLEFEARVRALLRRRRAVTTEDARRRAGVTAPLPSAAGLP